MKRLSDLDIDVDNDGSASWAGRHVCETGKHAGRYHRSERAIQRSCEFIYFQSFEIKTIWALRFLDNLSAQRLLIPSFFDGEIGKNDFCVRLHIRIPELV